MSSSTNSSNNSTKTTDFRTKYKTEVVFLAIFRNADIGTSVAFVPSINL